MNGGEILSDLGTESCPEPDGSLGALAEASEATCNITNNSNIAVQSLNTGVI